MVFHSLQQILSHLGGEGSKSFMQGDEFIFVFNGLRLQVKWTGTSLSFINKSTGDKSILFLFKKYLFNGESSVESKFIHSIINSGNYFSTSSIHNQYNKTDSTKLIVKLFELHDTIRQEKYAIECIDNTVQLSSKFYGDNVWARLEESHLFNDGTVCLKEDIGKIRGSDDYTPIFAIPYQYIFKEVVYYLLDEPRLLHFYDRDVDNSSGYIPSFIAQDDENTIVAFDAAYEKKFFFEKVGGYCEILKQYYRGTRELESHGELKSYHEDQENVIVRATGGNMFFGVELERSQVVSLDYEQAARDGWRCERDGTVAAEYISPVLSLTNIEESIEWIKSTSQGILDAEINERCGGHIHISVAGMTSNELFKKCVVFMPLLWAIYPARASNSYSARPNQSSSGYNPYMGSDRRDIVNKAHIGTVEFRIFPGCQGEHMLRFRLQLLSIIIRKAIEFGDNVTFSDALSFILSSDEMFGILSYVYNSAEKMQGISKRIEACFRSVDGISKDLDISKMLYDSVSDFVATKKPIDDEEIIESEDGDEKSI